MEKFLVEVSARHIHLDQASLETLFGKGYELHPKKYLSQPGMPSAPSGLRKARQRC